MPPNSFRDIVDIFINLGAALVPLLAVIALFAFAVGVGKFIRSTGEGKDIPKTKNFLIWGVIALFVLFSIWGIIAFLRGEFGWGTGNLGLPLLRGS